MRRLSPWIAMVLMLHLAACSPLTLFGNKPVTDYKQNQNPKQRYDITMTIADAPGPFASMEGLAQYDVINGDCLPPPDSNPGGYSSHLTRHIPFTITSVSENEYVGTVYADLMLDKDYHGRGVCRWQLSQTRIHMKATGAKGETIFIPKLSRDHFLSTKKIVTFFWKGHYPRNADVNLENPVSFGQVDRSKMGVNLSDGDLFTITLTPKEVRP